MPPQDYQDLSDRLTRLETITEEKWNSHDKRADERWSDLMDKMHEIGRKLDGRPCAEHSEAMVALNARIKAIEVWQNVVNWAVGVVYVGLVGALIKYIVG